MKYLVTGGAGFIGSNVGTGRSYPDPSRLEVSACCFSTHTGGLLDAP